MATGRGEPLRCCLRDARPGERLVLFGYRPPTADGPYREVGPVFAHAEPCRGTTGTGTRATGSADRRCCARTTTAAGSTRPRGARRQRPGGRDRAVLAEPGVVEVHSRNIAYGCFMFAVTAA